MDALLDITDASPSVRATSKSVHGQLDMSFDVEKKRLTTVRRILREHLNWWQIDAEVADRMLVAVNELLTNVLQHTEPDASGCRRASLLVQQVPGGVTAVVRDKDCHPPVQVTPKPLDEGGRGWMLVQALVDESSVSVSSAGKDMWVFIADPDTEQH
jgi:anti-sigma regulatory factor (Ser/Thr protein kinase)